MTLVAVGVASRGEARLADLFAALSLQTRVPDCIIVGSSRPADPGDLHVAEERHLAVTVAVGDGTGYTVNRNAVLREARRQGVTHLLWIDDDEVPDKQWVSELLRVSRDFACIITLGPVRRLWLPGTPEWAARANLPARAEYPDGLCDDPGRAGNCLLDLRSDILRDMTFDDRFNVSGGEDVDFIRRARAAGALVGWSASAIVSERPGPEMNHVLWYVRRAWRTGRLNGRSERKVPDVKRLPKAVTLALGGALTLRGDRLLCAAWELTFLAGQVTGLVTRPTE